MTLPVGPYDPGAAALSAAEVGIAKAIRLSRATMRNIRQDLFFALLYNALGIPVAAGVLYPFFGLLLSPLIAGAAMSLSSIDEQSQSHGTSVACQ